MIAPITGKLRKRFWLDITCGLGLGVAAGYAFWYGVHLKKVQQEEEYYLKLERAKRQEGGI